MALQLWVKEATPFIAMVLLECGEVGLTTTSKAAMNGGMSDFVFTVYYNILGILIFLPYFIFQTYRNKPPPLNFSLLFRFFLLGFLGKASKLLGYIGIGYSSPTLSAAIGNLTPVFTFLLVIIFGMEKLDIGRSSTKAKSLGTIVAVSGAFIVTLYKGPPIFSSATSVYSFDHHLQLLLSGGLSDWVLGGLCLAISVLLGTTGSILLASTVKVYPHQATIVFSYVLFGTAQFAVVSLVAERNPSAWTLRPGMEVVAIVYAAIYSSVIHSCVTTWCLNEKGPLFVSMFKPLGIVIAMTAGIIFLGDVLYLGSVIGATIIALGFYTVMWGQTKEKEKSADDVCIESLSQNTPLLKDFDSQVKNDLKV